jgi:hypothetical protein
MAGNDILPIQSLIRSHHLIKNLLPFSHNGSQCLPIIQSENSFNRAARNRFLNLEYI